MYKLVRTTLILATLTLVFGVALSVRAAEPTTLQTVTGGAINILSGGLIPSTVAIPLAQAVSGGSAITAAKDAIVDTIAGAGGSFIGWIGLKGIGYVLFAVSYIAGFIGSTAFTLASVLVTFGLYLNTTILDSEVVQLGWRFCRDLANLGFTIGIVVIAYATMLGYESYGMKNLIKNFILAAVLVNFSFSIAGFLIDISNMLTNFFVNAALGGGGVAGSWEGMKQFTETLASAFNPQKLLVTSDGLQAYESLKGDGILEGILSVFFVALFTAFAALGMLMVGLTTIWRFAQLSGLIIVMPLAILCYSFPNTQGYFKKWYGKFTCQLTYLPAATFSMYIVIMFVQIKAQVGFGSSQAININTLLNSFEQARGLPGGLTATKTLSLMAAPFQTITNMVLVLTMLFLGITESRNIGCAGGEIALKWAKGLREWATGTVTGAPAWAGRKVLSGGVDEEGRNRGTRLGNIMSNIPLVRRLIPRLNDFAAGTSKNIGNLVTENKKLGKVQLMTKMRSLEILTSAEDMAAAAKVAAEEGYFSEEGGEEGLTQKEFERFIAPVKRYGMEADILKKLPYLYGKFGLNVEKDSNGDYVNKEDGKKFDDVMKAFKAEDIESFPVEAFEDLEVVRRLSGDQLTKLPKGKEHRDAFSNTVVRLREKIGSEEFDKYVQKTFAKKEAAAALTPQLLANKDVVRNLTNDHLKYISDADKGKQRTAFLDTINEKDKNTGEYVLSEKEFDDFMKKNFVKGKSIEEIHPDILRNERVFSRLKGMHINQLQQTPDTEQQLAVIQTLRKEYLNNTGSAYEKGGKYSEEKTAHLDELAATIVKNKDNPIWSMITTSEAKDDFLAIENEYRSRHPDENPKPKNQNQQQKNKPDDDDAYGPSAPPPPTQGPYPGGAGGPSRGNEPPKPPTPPPPPYPAGAGPSLKPTPPIPAPQATAVNAAPIPTAVPPAPNNPSQAAPTIKQTAVNPTQPRKSFDIGAAIDAALENSKMNPPSDVETNEEFTQPATQPPSAANAQQKTGTNSTVKTPLPSELSEEYLASLEAATNSKTPQSPQIVNVTPITPEELNKLAESEKIRLEKDAELLISRSPEIKKTPPLGPIDVEFRRATEPITKPKEATPAEPPLKRITYEGPLTPPEQKPTTTPEPVKTIMERERNANENQISVIPKFMPADQPKRITYQGPVIPPPTPTLPEPIRTILQKEKNEKDNQVERKNTL